MVILLLFLGRIFVYMRDGKKIYGILRMFDQYGTELVYEMLTLVFSVFIGNIVLHDAVERIFIGKEYSEEHCGVFIIRGENILLMGEFFSSSGSDAFENEASGEAMSLLGLEEKPMVDMLQKQKDLREESKRIAKYKRELRRNLGLMEAEILADLDA
jgi:U6 snRNA-associated Sm-like protein LSm1